MSDTPQTIMPLEETREGLNDYQSLIQELQRIHQRYLLTHEETRDLLPILTSALHHLEAGKLREHRPVHPNPNDEPPPRVFFTGDNSACVHINENLAYDIYGNGELVAIQKKGEVTYFHEWSPEDLTPSTQTVEVQP